MITSIAWRNVWRSPRRSLVIIFSTIIGVAAGIFLLAFFNGWTNQRLYDVIHTELASIQIHDSLFLENEDIRLFLPDVTTKLEAIQKIEGVKGVSSQLSVNSMVKIAQENMGMKISGIDPDAKASVSDLPSRIVYGSWFGSDKANPLVMSYLTAKRLGVIVYQLDAARLDSLRIKGLEPTIISRLDTFTSSPSLMRLNEYQFNKQLDRILGKELSASQRVMISDQAFFLRERIKINVMVQDSSGNFHEESYSLCGIYKTSNTMFDEMNVFAQRSDLERMSGLGPEDAHEISVLIDDGHSEENVQAKIRALFPGAKVQSWKELDPVAKFYADWMGSYTIMFMSIILLALFFGIVNTMLMAVLERTKEIGMLKAVGMNAGRLFRMIVMESVFLTLTGSVIGIGVGVALNTYFGVHPLDLGMFAQGLEEYGFASVIKTSISTRDIITITIMCIITGILASIVPAIKAIRLRPVDAIRID
jgi:putative ABC transport system permease protein